MAEIVVHGVVTLALLAAYLTLEVTGHDGEAILGALLGWLGSGATVGAIQKTKAGA